MAPLLEDEATDELLAGVDEDAGATEDEAGAWLELATGVELGFTLPDPPPPPPQAVNIPPIDIARSNLDVFINRSLFII